MEKGDTYLAAKTRKRRAKKGRESELQGPDSQLRSASSSPAWQGDKHSKGCNGQPCASGACILNLEGKKRAPRRGCWRLDKNQQFYEDIYTKQVTENLDTAQTGTRYSCRTAARAISYPQKRPVTAVTAMNYSSSGMQQHTEIFTIARKTKCK